ncbi:MAG: 50S ribosomal protein L29 [Nanoarchaeota archaeon]
MKAIKEFRDLSSAELAARLEELKKELLKMNVQVALGAGTSNPGNLRKAKKNIARIETILQEKQQEKRRNLK